MRRDEVKRLVRRANKQQQFAAVLQHNLLVANDGEQLRLDWHWGTRLSKADFEWAFDLFCRNMRELYLKSQWGYDERSKRKELSATTARFLILRTMKTASGRPIAFVHFRFVEDEGRPVLYCYELQVEPDYQQKGIGTLLINCMDRLAKSSQMALLMATVFAFNAPSLAFFHKCGFRTDATCRFGRDGTDGRDFVILSRRPKNSEEEAVTQNPRSDQNDGVVDQNRIVNDDNDDTVGIDFERKEN